MRSAVKLKSQVTPDHLSDDPATIADFLYGIKNLATLNDNTLVVIGESGLTAYDVSNGILRRIDEIVEIGTDAIGSVCRILEGGVGSPIRGVLFKEPQGNLRLFDGYGAQIISDPIRDDFEDTYLANNRGIAYHNATTVQSIYLPHYRKLVVAYDGQLFVMDTATGSNDWYNWVFAKHIDAVCNGVDGEMFFTDGDEVWQFPKAGTDDTPEPIWKPQDKAVPMGYRGILKKIWLDYLCAGITIQPTAYRDKCVSPSKTSTTSTLAASATKTRAQQGWNIKTAQFAREFAPEIHVTTPASCTAFELEQVVMTVQLEAKKPV